MDRALKIAIQEEGIEAAGRYYGVYHGIVTSNNDPEKRGRLKVKIPSIFGEDVFDKWVYGKAIYNGDNIGIFAIPTIGSGVFITFMNGDVELPIWEMGWFADSEMSDEFKERYLDGITFKQDRIYIKGKNAEIEIFTNGDINIEGSGKIDIKAKSGDVDIRSDAGKIGISANVNNLRPLLSQLAGLFRTLIIVPNPATGSLQADPATIAQASLIITRLNQLLK